MPTPDRQYCQIDSVLDPYRKNLVSRAKSCNTASEDKKRKQLLQWRAQHFSPIAFFFGPKPRFRPWANSQHHKRYHQFIELLSQLDHNINPRHQHLLTYLTLFIQLRDIQINHNISINSIIKSASKAPYHLKGKLDIYLSGAISGLTVIRSTIQSGHLSVHTPQQLDMADDSNKTADSLYLRVIESHDIAIYRLQKIHNTIFLPCEDELAAPLLLSNSYV